MRSHLIQNVPVVAICNISETFYDFLSRAPEATLRADLIHGEQYRCDRTLMWLGDPKLVFATYPIPHAEDFCRRYGYPGTQYIAPSTPSPFLSLDIMREPRLLAQLVKYAGAERSVQLIPYATTPQFFQLVDHLQTDYNLTVLLPESPSRDDLWLRDYIDTKAGFRLLVSRWLPNADQLLPEGVVCPDRQQAAAVAHWFSLNRQDCLVKADRGEDSIGHFVIRPGDFASVIAIHEALKPNPFLGDEWITVEQLLPSSALLSPSLELFVPRHGSGEPTITYLCGQHFLEFAGAHGIWVSRELYEAAWYPTLAESGLQIAARLQEMGYVGHFDIDTIVDDEGRLFIVEINARRTGGTHVHEFAHYFLGPDYLDNFVLLGNDSIDSGHIVEYNELMQVIGDLLYPMPGQNRGVVITVTSALEAHEFGCIAIAESTEQASALHHTLAERIHNAGG
ncbi:MAG: hypothetical protein KDI62_11475 [Anaerolineae bacterium]|nr:hypothetical protein [Anaerolineae bacterium]MCB9105134.1 hypothetical protein [Anaerolineales bacterium]